MIVGIFCPECGERVRNVGLDPEKSKIENLPCRCKRCHNYFAITAGPTKKQT